MLDSPTPHFSLPFPPHVQHCYSFEYFPAFLGCLRAGAIACPVYPIDPSKMEIALTKFKHVVEDTGAKVVLTDKLINRVRIGCNVFYGSLMPKTVEWRVTDHLVQQRGKNIPSFDHKVCERGHEMGGMILKPTFMHVCLTLRLLAYIFLFFDRDASLVILLSFNILPVQLETLR